MTILLTALGATAAITASTTPLMGMANVYNATAGALTPPLPALGTQNVGATTVVEITPLDTSGNTVTFSCAGTDTFSDGSTSLVLSGGGEQRYLQVVEIGSAVKHWKIMGGLTAAGVTATGSTTLSNKTLNNTNTITVKDTNLTIQDDADTTKQLKWQASGIPTGTTRTITAPTADGTAVVFTQIPCDFTFVSVLDATTRATGSGDWTYAMEVQRAFTITKVVYQFGTADASGSSTVEIRRNGSQVTSSNISVTAANQATGTGTQAARTATFTQSFAVGDTFLPQITAVGTTPGKALRVWVFGTWN